MAEDLGLALTSINRAKSLFGILAGGNQAVSAHRFHSGGGSRSSSSEGLMYSRLIRLLFPQGLDGLDSDICVAFDIPPGATLWRGSTALTVVVLAGTHVKRGCFSVRSAQGFCKPGTFGGPSFAQERYSC